MISHVCTWFFIMILSATSASLLSQTKPVYNTQQVLYWRHQDTPARREWLHIITPQRRVTGNTITCTYKRSFIISELCHQRASITGREWRHLEINMTACLHLFFLWRKGRGQGSGGWVCRSVGLLAGSSGCRMALRGETVLSHGGVFQCRASAGLAGRWEGGPLFPWSWLVCGREERSGAVADHSGR